MKLKLLLEQMRVKMPEKRGIYYVSDIGFNTACLQWEDLEVPESQLKNEYTWGYIRHKTENFK
jgi:hypothetical protein